MGMALSPCTVPHASEPSFTLGEDEIEIGIGIHGEPGRERIALEPATTVVATEFPRALLADWGLPVSPDRAGELVRAEMLYSAEGEALAVRLVN